MPPSTRWPQSPRDLPSGARRPAPPEAPALSRSSQVNFRFDIHTRPKLVVLIFARLDNNLYRDPLDDFHVVAGCVLRRQQAEDGPGCSGNAIHMSLVRAAVRVELDLCLLADAHVFLESCVSLKFAVIHTWSNGTTVSICCSRAQTFNPTTTFFVTSPVTGANILVYPRFNWGLFDSSSFLLRIRHGGKGLSRAGGGDALRPPPGHLRSVPQLP